MPSAYVLYITDDTVGPCLELIRNICDPKSDSEPHITVRYPINKLRENDLSVYQTVKISEIRICEAGAFGLDDPSPGRNRTVFLNCASDELETLSYKPNYPDSVFHVTLYDDKSLVFAKQLLKVLQRFKWNFTVPLPKSTGLTQIEIGKHRSKKAKKTRIYPPRLVSLFRQITSEKLNPVYIDGLSDKRRLELVYAISAYLHTTAANFSTAITPKKSTKRHTNGAILDRKHRRLYNVRGSKYGLFLRKPVLSSPSDQRQGASNRVDLYLTPPELAHEIVKYAVSKLSPHVGAVHFGDPATGTGVFFSALCQVLPDDKIGSAIGIEIDPERGSATQRRWSHRGLHVVSGDYLHMDLLPRRTLIIANPPYIRYQNVQPDYRVRLRERASVQTGIHISGQSGLYVYFLLLSHAWMDLGAIAAWLIPSEFMETNYGLAIRQYLTQKVQLIRIHQFSLDTVQFENALVSSAVVVFRNNPPVTDQTACLTSGGSLLHPEHTEQVKVGELKREGKWTIPWVRKHRFSSSHPRLGNLFKVHRGLATGANSFFIMERSMALQRGIPEIALRPVLPKARVLRGDIIEREEDGYPRVVPQLCLLDCALPEEQIREMYPYLMRYLESIPKSMLSRTLVRNRHPWYKQEQRQPAPFLCTYMGRGGQNSAPLRFFWNKSDAIATNTYLMLYPQNALDRLVTERPDMLASIFIFLKETISQSLLDNGRVYGGGLHKIEPRELLNVHLSFLPSWLEEVLGDQTPLLPEVGSTYSTI
jgi:adenine-specific DNA-methyltransferase